MRSNYVIVGAGSAGCVLARRLTEDPDVTVTLVEAGGDDRDPRIHMPAAFAELFRGPLDWNYDTVPQPRVGNRRQYWPRGKVVGGCTSLNAMIYMRGHPRDYDEWAEHAGLSWSYANVLEYFKKSERHHRGESEYHGGSGPLCVNPLRDVHPLSAAFVASAEAAGMRRTDDFNGAEHGGFGAYEVTQSGGKRHSAWRAFVRPVLDRPNLQVVRETLVHAVVFDGERRATGVRAVAGGAVLEIHADREVLLCAGTINSPQLLMLSGIGPGTQLQELAIEVVCDRSAVGDNLRDHLSVPMVFATSHRRSLAWAERMPGILIELGKYLIAKRGMLASNVAEVGGFANTRDDDPRPDLQYHVAPGYFRHHGTLKAAGHHFSVGPTLVRPESRGSVRLASTRPEDPPLIDPRYCEDPRDLASLLAGLRLARRIVASPPLANWTTEEVLPGAGQDDDEALTAHVAAEAQTLYHPVGTCRMGRDDDAVVDAALRVRGVDGLRVIDASIMPTIVCGNTNAPTLMIAEKAADLIRGDA